MIILNYCFTEVRVEERPRSLPLYNFQGQRMKSVRSRPSNGSEPSSTRYIFAYEDDDEASTAHSRRGRRSHRFPVAKEQFRFSSERGVKREFRREYVQGSTQRLVEAEPVLVEQEPQQVRRYVLAEQPAAPRSAEPASYRTEFVEADGRAYNREFFDGDAVGHPIPAADGPASIIVEDRGPDIGYGRPEPQYGAVREPQYGAVRQPPSREMTHPEIGYNRYAAGSGRPDMLY